MGCGDDVGQAYERRMTRRLFGEDVECSTGEMAGAQGFGKGGFVHQLAAGCVDEPGARLHAGDGSGVKQKLGGRAERGVQGDEVGAGEEIVKRDQLRAGVAGDFLADVRIASEDVKVKGAGAASDFEGDAAQSDQAERLAAKLGAACAALFPTAGVDGGVQLRNRACQGKQES